MKWIPYNGIILLILIVITFCSDSPNKLQTQNTKEIKEIKTISPINPNNNSPTEKKNQKISKNLSSTLTTTENKKSKEPQKTPSLKKVEISEAKNTQNSNFKLKETGISFLLKNQKVKKSKEENNSEIYMDYDKFFNIEENKKFALGEEETISAEKESQNNFLEKGQVNKKKKPAKGKKSAKGKGKGKKVYKFKILIKDQESFLNKLRESFKSKKKNKNTVAQEKIFNKYSKCSIKSGILLEFKGIKTNIKTLTHEAIMKPTYIELTKESINFKSEINSEKNIKSAPVYKILRLKQILRISQQKSLQKYACFDLVHFKTAKSKEETKVTICAENSQIMQKWVNAIQDFKECQIKVTKINNNDKLVYDFSKINHLLKLKKKELKIVGNKIPPKINREKNLYYNNEPVKVRRPKKDKALKRVAKKILNNFRVMRIRESQVKRKYADKVKTAKKFHAQMSKKVNAVKRGVMSKIRKDKMKNIKNKIDMEKTKELDLLKAAENRLKTMRKIQINNIKKKYKRKYNGALKKAEKKSKKIMKIIMESKKLSPYEECIDPRLKNFMDANYSKGVCIKIFGQHVNIILFYFNLIFSSKNNVM